MSDGLSPEAFLRFYGWMVVLSSCKSTASRQDNISAWDIGARTTGPHSVVVETTNGTVNFPGSAAVPNPPAAEIIA
jgi:hypothetical protein